MVRLIECEAQGEAQGEAEAEGGWDVGLGTTGLFCFRVTLFPGTGEGLCVPTAHLTGSD